MSIKGDSFFFFFLRQFLNYQVACMVKNPHANAGDIRDTGLILGWKDPL